jgi:hypothetical protein
VTAVSRRVLRIAPFKKKAGLLVAFLVEVMKQVGRGLGRQLARKLIESAKKRQKIRFGTGGGHRLHLFVQLDQSLQNALFCYGHMK